MVAAVESLVRHVMEQLPSAVVLLVESYAWKDPDLNPTPLAYRAVALQYGIALVSYAAVARSASESWIAECDPEIKPCGNHPPWTTHAAVADALVVSMVALHRELEGARRIHADEALSRASLRRSRAAAPDGAATSEATTAAATSDSLPTPISPAQLLERYAVCKRPLSYYAARAHAAGQMGAAPQPHTTSGKWSAYEDRPGKPGWITTGPEDSTIR